MNRRDFAKLIAGATASTILPVPANAAPSKQVFTKEMIDRAVNGPWTPPVFIIPDNLPKVTAAMLDELIKNGKHLYG